MLFFKNVDKLFSSKKFQKTDYKLGFLLESCGAKL